jgi:hypothetical protein
VHLDDRVIDIDQHELADGAVSDLTDQWRVAPASPARNCDATASSWRTSPKVKLRRSHGRT